jgi:hypothetical protein
VTEPSGDATAGLLLDRHSVSLTDVVRLSLVPGHQSSPEPR